MDQLRSEQDVEEILKIAIQNSGGALDQSLRSRLQNTAQELGISPEVLEQAEKQYLERRESVQELAEYSAARWQGFYAHLASFLIVNFFLVVVSVLTDSGAWPIWPILGWGIGLTFHFVFTRFKPKPDDEGFIEWKVEREVRKKLGGSSKR